MNIESIPACFKPNHNLTLAELRKVVVTTKHPAVLENTLEMAYLLGRLHALTDIPDQSRAV